MTLIFPTRITAALVTLIAICLAAPGRADEHLSILVTADLEGRAGSCGSCPSESGGGLARLASSLAKLRKENPDALLLDAGNALIGADSVASSGGLIVAAYNELRYDALNLSYRDFRFGKAETLNALKQARFAVISANLLDEQSGQPMAKPYVVKTVGQQRIAIIGVCDLPVALASLPHIKRELQGIRVQAAAEALAAWLPKAKGESDRIVLMYYGSANGLAAVQEKFGKDLAAIVVGGIRPEQLPADGKPPVATTAEHGRQIALLTLGEKPSLSQSDIDEKIAADPAMQKVIEPFMPKLAVATSAPAASQPLVTPALTKMELGKTYPLNIGGQNLAAHLTVTQAALLDKYQDVAPAAGHKLLCLSTLWQNITPPKAGADGNIDVGYKVPELSDHVYLVVNGLEVSRLMKKTTGGAQMLGSEIQLAKMGETLAGDAVFEVPADAPWSLELRFYDYISGHIAMPVLLDSARKIEPKLAAGPQKNAVVEISAFDLTTRGKASESGMTALSLDMRARSMLTIKGDKGAAIGTVADWPDCHKYIQLVVDGEYAYSMTDQSTLGEKPRFLPDLPTGGGLFFNVPVKHQSLELRCDMPSTSAADEAAKHPAPITLLLEGKRPELPKRETKIEFVDDMFTIQVVGQDAPEKFAGAEPPKNSKWFVMTVSVANSAKGGEFFQAKPQVKYTAESGAGILMHEATAQALHPAGDIVWVPGGERRTFEMVFAIPAKDKRPRVMLTGSSSAKTFELNRLVAADIKPPEPTQPPTKPVVIETPPVVVTPERPATKPVVVETPAVVVTPQTKPVEVAIGPTEPPKVEPPKVDPPKIDPPKMDPPKVDPPKVDPPKIEPAEGTLKTTIPAGSEPKLYIILDGSGSMLEEMDGKTKFDIARSAIEAIIKDAPAKTQAALRVYGHTKRATDDGADTDTVLEIAMGPLDKDEFASKLDDLRPRGKTPLALSLREAAKDLARVKGPVTVILLTDGVEDTQPRQDPLKAADEIGKLSNVKLHVVGFDVGREDWVQNLQAITKRGQGQYYPAPRASELLSQMRGLIPSAPEQFVVTDADGHEAAKGKFGQSIKLAAGKYTLRAAVPGGTFEEAFEIKKGDTATVAFDLEKVKPSPAAPIETPTVKPPVVEQPAPAARKFCTNCGAPLKPGAKFCTGCGAKVGE